MKKKVLLLGGQNGALGSDEKAQKMEVGFNFSTVRKFLLILFISTKMMSWVARNKQIKLFVVQLY